MGPANRTHFLANNTMNSRMLSALLVVTSLASFVNAVPLMCKDHPSQRLVAARKKNGNLKPFYKCTDTSPTEFQPNGGECPIGNRDSILCKYHYVYLQPFRILLCPARDE